VIVVEQTNGWMIQVYVGHVVSTLIGITMKMKNSMKDGYKVLKTMGTGLYIQVCNYKYLNEIAHYRYMKESDMNESSNRVGVWKPKLIK